MQDKTMERLEMEMGLDRLIQNMDLILKSATHHAKVRRKKFEALLEEGFTEEQALQIVIHTNAIE